ncbi:hypothetical protein [uncultured Tenacibaculum sp.]|uniref:hypothetical protein n=1 Tax=uncultured Tenacibaculum sp. TaxID=174713 RepID=UPI00262C221C|nr:hypothetical protein [uncultured Tenacibaculum sp.]
MKKRFKIAALAVMGMSLVLNAQEKVTTENGDKADFVYKEGKVGIGTTTPDKKLTVLNNIKILKSGNARTQGDKAELIFGELNSDSYSGGIRIENTNSNPGYVNPKMVFSLQNRNTSTLDQVKDRMTISPRGYVGIGTSDPKSQFYISGGSNDWNDFNQGHALGTIHLDPENTSDNYGNAITFGASDSSDGETAQAGIYVRSDGGYGTKMYFSTTNSYAVGSKTAMAIDADGKVGIGLGAFNPKSQLHITGGSSDWNELSQGHALGTIHLDPENASNNFGNAITFGASDSNAGETAQAGIYVRSDGGYGTKMYFSTTNSYAVGSKTAMAIDSGGKVGIGTTSTGSHRLAVEGSIGAREIKVEATGWSDFVFYNDYKLPSLMEVENHIKEKGHLKDIPSAKDVEKNGFYLGEMDAKLLQKIEELTLYTIEQEKKITVLEKQNSKLEKQEKEIEELKYLVKKLIEKKN